MYPKEWGDKYRKALAEARTMDELFADDEDDIPVFGKPYTPGDPRPQHIHVDSDDYNYSTDESAFDNHDPKD